MEVEERIMLSDEIDLAMALQREHAKAHKAAVADRKWSVGGRVIEMHQAAQAWAFRLQWICRFGSLRDLEKCE